MANQMVAEYRTGGTSRGLLFAFCDCRGHLQPGYARAELHEIPVSLLPVASGQALTGLLLCNRFARRQAASSNSEIMESVIPILQPGGA
jgi:hypothetical protein